MAFSLFRGNDSPRTLGWRFQGANSMPEETDDILRLARSVRSEGRVSVRRMGSFVNDVFLVKVEGERYVAKRYTNWLSLKWFALSLYGLGSVRFSISGRRRMEAEYYFNDFLYRRGLPVPRILASDIRSRLILFSYAAGEQLLSRLAGLLGFSEPGQTENEAASSAGAFVAGSHELDVALGDTRPENFIVENKNSITFVDLEQAKHRGDFAWDVAEFLYYSGHYWLFYTENVSAYVDGFIRGYLGHGDPRVLRSAASPKYVRVFSIWTPPNILHNIRKRLLKPQLVPPPNR